MEPKTTKWLPERPELLPGCLKEWATSKHEKAGKNKKIYAKHEIMSKEDY